MEYLCRGVMRSWPITGSRGSARWRCGSLVSASLFCGQYLRVNMAAVVSYNNSRLQRPYPSPRLSSITKCLCCAYEISASVNSVQVIVPVLENFSSLFTFLRFPLYPKGGEKLQFDYGVYLLNKNIAQVSDFSFLLVHC